MQKLVFDPVKQAWFVGTVTEEGTMFNDGDELSPAGIASRLNVDIREIKVALRQALRKLEAV